MKTSDSKHNLMEQNWEIWKRQIRNNVKYSLLGLLVFHVTILWLTDFRSPLQIYAQYNIIQYNNKLSSSSSKYRIDSKDRVKLFRRGDYKF